MRAGRRAARAQVRCETKDKGRHSCANTYLTPKIWTTRYAPRGGLPCRSATSTRWHVGSRRAESACPAWEGGGST
eukprot:4933153-Prymnesium_polylepis.1